VNDSPHIADRIPDDVQVTTTVQDCCDFLQRLLSSPPVEPASGGVVTPELEEFVRTLPSGFLQSLRGLRDDFKLQLSFVATSRYSTNDILYQYREQDERPVVESFIELFKGHQRFISRLDYHATIRNIERYQARYKQLLPDGAKNLLYLATLGHAGLLRTSYFAVLDHHLNTNVDVLHFCKSLLVDEGVRSECHTIMNSLLHYERDALLRWVVQPVPQQDLFSLINKQLFVSQDGKLQLLPLLHAFASERPGSFDSSPQT
jgi:hypothetical protein